MSDSERVYEAVPVLTARDEEARTHALIASVLMLVGLFTGIFWLVGGIWAWVARRDARTTRFDDHYSNLLRVFLWGSLWMILGSLLMVILVGYVVALVGWVWAAWRLTCGLIRLINRRPYAA